MGLGTRVPSAKKGFGQEEKLKTPKEKETRNKEKGQ